MTHSENITAIPHLPQAVPVKQTENLLRSAQCVVTTYLKAGETMRLGIFGGTFDPVHYGHLLLAESCREQLKLDEIRFVPAATPPHKVDQPITDGQSRADMLSLAVSGYPEFVVDRRELKRKSPSFTVDTLVEFAAEFPAAELYFLVGADSLRDLLTWREPERITKLATLVACNRPGLPELQKAQVVQWVGPEIADRILTLQMAGTDISASEMRDRVRDGRSLRFLTPRAVETYVFEHGLYARKSE
jgi:nicotinate-nucleotide adenylyltransferase